LAKQIDWSKILAGFVAVQILGLAWSRTRNLIANAWDAVFRFVPGVYRFHDMRRHFRQGGHVWDYRRSKKLTKAQRQNLPKVLTVMNFKGGVGKTTLVANLACAMAKRFNLRVLVVDLDYQGSLSSLLRPANLDVGRQDLVGDWLRSQHPNGVQADFFTTSTIYAELPIDLATSNYELTEIENNQLQRWLLHADNSTVDLPLKFARMLSTKRNGFLRYDLIIMDAPPRLSVASINALIASSHVLIPVKLEHLATDPISKLLGQLSQLSKQFRAEFKVIGAICNMTWRSDGPTQPERPFFNSIAAALPPGSKVYHPFVPDKPIIARPGSTAIAYMLDNENGQQVRSWFDPLAFQILRDMGLEVRDEEMIAQFAGSDQIVAAE